MKYRPFTYIKISFALFGLCFSGALQFTAHSLPQLSLKPQISNNNKKNPEQKLPAQSTLANKGAPTTDFDVPIEHIDFYVRPKLHDVATCKNQDPNNPKFLVLIEYSKPSQQNNNNLNSICISPNETLYIKAQDLVFDRWGPLGSELAQFNSADYKEKQVELFGGFQSGNIFELHLNETGYPQNGSYKPGLDFAQQPDILLDGALITRDYFISFESQCSLTPQGDPICPFKKIGSTLKIHGEIVDAYGEIYNSQDLDPINVIDVNQTPQDIEYYFKDDTSVMKINIHELPEK